MPNIRTSPQIPKLNETGMARIIQIIVPSKEAFLRVNFSGQVSETNGTKISRIETEEVREAKSNSTKKRKQNNPPAGIFANNEGIVTKSRAGP